jgi:hypothetical protein
MPPFDYLTIMDRKVSDYEYNVETMDHWPWNQVFVLRNNLKGGMKQVDSLKVAEDYHAWINDDENIPERLECKESSREYVDDTLALLKLLERSDFIKIPSKVCYYNWMYVRCDVLDII